MLSAVDLGQFRPVSGRPCEGRSRSRGQRWCAVRARERAGRNGRVDETHAGAPGHGRCVLAGPGRHGPVVDRVDQVRCGEPDARLAGCGSRQRRRGPRPARDVDVDRRPHRDVRCKVGFGRAGVERVNGRRCGLHGSLPGREAAGCRRGTGGPGSCPAAGRANAYSGGDQQSANGPYGHVVAAGQLPQRSTRLVAGRQARRGQPPTWSACGGGSGRRAGHRAA